MVPQGEAKVSVIIPAHNARATIARTLASACAQTYRNIEVIVVDDGSRDGTVQEAASFMAGDPRVRLLTQPHLGVAAARNLAWRNSEGAFIAPLDADDLWHPTKLEKQVRRMTERPNCGLVYAWSRLIDENDLVTGVQYPLSAAGDVFLLMLVDNFIGNGSTPLIRREALEAIGGYDLSLRAAAAQGCEDWKMQLLVAERYPFDLVPEFLTGYRSSHKGISADTGVMSRSRRLVIDEMKRRHPVLPSFVFAWHEAKVKRRDARHFFRKGRYRRAAKLFADSMPLDALGGLIGLAAGVERSFSQRFHRFYEPLLAPSKRVTGRPFFDVDPRARGWVGNGWSVQRRQATMRKTRYSTVLEPDGAQQLAGAAAMPQD